MIIRSTIFLSLLVMFKLKISYSRLHNGKSARISSKGVKVLQTASDGICWLNEGASLMSVLAITRSVSKYLTSRVDAVLIV